MAARRYYYSDSITDFLSRNTNEIVGALTLASQHAGAGFLYRIKVVGQVLGHAEVPRTCIFVNGCFWHGHHINLQFDDLQFTISNSGVLQDSKRQGSFWVAKIRRNKEGGKEEQRKLAEMGWHCITVWECELKPSKREETLDSIAFTRNHYLVAGSWGEN